MSQAQLDQLQAALAEAQEELAGAIRETRKARKAVWQAGAIAALADREADEAMRVLKAAKKKVDRACRISRQTEPTR